MALTKRPASLQIGPTQWFWTRLAAARLALPEKQHKPASNQIPQHGITLDPVFLHTRSASSCKLRNATFFDFFESLGNQMFDASC